MTQKHIMASFRTENDTTVEMPVAAYLEQETSSFIEIFQSETLEIPASVCKDKHNIQLQPDHCQMIALG